MPGLAKKIGYCKFGIFMEMVISYSLEYADESVVDAVGRLKSEIKDPYSRYFKPKDYQEVGDLVREHFTFPGQVEYEPEWHSGVVVGHPDLVYQDCVYDIKTTGRFNAMRSETILQVLSYFCLAQNLDKPISKVGLVLPAQRLVLVCDLSGWNWKPFWEALQGCVSLKRRRQELYPPNLMLVYRLMSQMSIIGGHVEKRRLLEMIPYGIPLQFFVAGRASSKISLAEGFKRRLKSSISKHKAQVFIHSPYILNLSKPWSKKKESEKSPWVCDQLRRLLQLGSECGLGGIVVHCGKAGGLELSEAVSQMRKSVELAVKDAPKDCPLLIETSSGQGGEILCAPEELASFWLSLSPSAKKKVEVCVDTCHVFAAGYDPVEYIVCLESASVPISLIHYNDSKCSKGSKKDRHAPIGHGYVGIEPLINVVKWATSKGIPCVRE